MMNGFSEEILMEIIKASTELADLFEEYSEETDNGFYLNKEGMEILGESFGNIHEDMRGMVFEHLLMELEDREIPFDIDQFIDDDSRIIQ
ncbi:hypothetical protein LCGC14_1392820 [marine sediment metagenome]|uniref:Uncharacterized protein n=1 Tax=marine sediment metagenome TaxID=412755 RepID=A0A0F9N111_9ZZZZ